LTTSVGERIGVLDARIAEQARRVADVELQGREIADAVAKMTSTGKAKFAIAASRILVACDHVELGRGVAAEDLALDREPIGLCEVLILQVGSDVWRLGCLAIL